MRAVCDAAVCGRPVGQCGVARLRACPPQPCAHTRRNKQHGTLGHGSSSAPHALPHCHLRGWIERISTETREKERSGNRITGATAATLTWSLFPLKLESRTLRSAGQPPPPSPSRSGGRSGGPARLALRTRWPAKRQQRSVSGILQPPFPPASARRLLLTCFYRSDRVARAPPVAFNSGSVCRAGRVWAGPWKSTALVKVSEAFPPL